MFDHTADLYDAFYDALDKDYGQEARKLIRLVKRVRSARGHRNRPLRTLLDVACGTGRHLEAFAGDHGLECTGVDMSEPMLAIARRRNANARFLRGDMTTLDLAPDTFDVVT